MPPKHKNKNATNRDRRHENGLAPPAKQVKKQKSDGQINGHANQPTTNGSPNSSQVNNASQSRTEDVANTSQGTSTNMAPSGSFLAAIEHHPSSATDADIAGPPTTFAYAEGTGPSAVSHQESWDKTSNRASTATSSKSASAVIAQWAGFDVVAILLVLMQLPYSVLGIIYMCFAFLTFGSPPTGWSLSSILSTSDWLHGHSGSPSIVTMIFVDLVFLGLWCLLPLGKDFTLDLAQAVVAISLGGGTSGGSGRGQGIFCFSIVATHHLLGQRMWSTRYWIVAWFCSILNAVTTNTNFGPFDPDDILDALDIAPDTDRNWPRTLLELHIVTQGIVRIVRRWFIRPSIQKLAVRKGDSDPAYIPPGSPIVPGTAALQDSVRNTSSDGRHPGPSPANREFGREKSGSIVKKKRKQATFVRSQQPFWAAIASTKVTVSKEIEQSQASQDLSESGATGLDNLGSSINRCNTHCVWITHVQDTEIEFQALFPKDKLSPGEEIQPTDRKPSVDIQQLLVVLINGAEWASTNLSNEGSHDDKKLVSGKIFGLTARTNYLIEFVKPDTEEVITTVQLATRPDETIEQAPSEGPFRPSSPVSTLKKSIGAEEGKLAERRNRSRRSKRDHRASTNAFKKEIDNILGKVSNCGGADERQRQRQFQYRQTIKQAEDNCATLADKLETMGEIPERERQAASESKKKWYAEKRAHSDLRGELDNAKAELTKQLSSMRAEITQLQQKRERTNARLNQLNVRRDGLVSAKEKDDEEQKRRDQTRQNEMVKYENEERRLAGILRQADTQRAHWEEQLQQVEHHVQAAELSIKFNATMSSDSPYHPQTPEGPYTSLAYPNRPTPAFANILPYQQQQPIGTPLIHSRRGSLMKQAPQQSRARSSSMLSNVSGLTDDQVAGGNPPLNGHHAAEMQFGRQDSGSSGRPGTGNRPSTTSPAPMKQSPIGAEREKYSPRYTRG